MVNFQISNRSCLGFLSDSVTFRVTGRSRPSYQNPAIFKRHFRRLWTEIVGGYPSQGTSTLKSKEWLYQLWIELFNLWGMPYQFLSDQPAYFLGS
jgi:hypothetical protein